MEGNIPNNLGDSFGVLIRREPHVLTSRRPWSIHDFFDGCESVAFVKTELQATHYAQRIGSASNAGIDDMHIRA